MSTQPATIAISLLVHGEAVRFNRGQNKKDDFDFKYMRGLDGSIYPYVSSQCYKKYWRELLPEPFSPITRPKPNHAFTDGNPIKFIDDDLFGYMIAGAGEIEGDSQKEESEEPESNEDAAILLPEDSEQDGSKLFTVDDIKDTKVFLKKLLSPKSTDLLSQHIYQQIPNEKQPELKKSDLSEDQKKILVDALNKCLQDANLYNTERFPKTKKDFAKIAQETDTLKRNRSLLQKAYPKELGQKQKRPTTKRTAPVRMHALVGFSGIKTAKDFQTLSRDVPYTGKDSVLNPKPPSIYSGWLKTRILIEYHRIGKFYIGDKMDILEEQAKGLEIQKEKDPYSRIQKEVSFIQLEEKQRQERLEAVLKALANIGNTQGPASGALHDGSLRPKAFVAGIMRCADSPFDYVWKGTHEQPVLDVESLAKSIQDWQDLFLSPKIYIGLPVDLDASRIEDIKNNLQEKLKKLVFKKDTVADITFEAIIDTPRQALIKLAEQVKEEIKR